MLIGVLQQFRGTAVARSPGWQRELLPQFGTIVIVLPNFYQVFLLAMRIQQPILMEEPKLQLLGHLFRGLRVEG